MVEAARAYNYWTMIDAEREEKKRRCAKKNLNQADVDVSSSLMDSGLHI